MDKNVRKLRSKDINPCIESLNYGISLID
ncbi:unnamed protein product [Coregonus sp. 'balchen']|nr:unnamed protein product [Coregonus sp. 'balchen']